MNGNQDAESAIAGPPTTVHVDNGPNSLHRSPGGLSSPPPTLSHLAPLSVGKAPCGPSPTAPPRRPPAGLFIGLVSLLMECCYRNTDFRRPQHSAREVVVQQTFLE